MDAQDRQDYLDQMGSCQGVSFFKENAKPFLNSKGYVKRTTNLQVLCRKILIINWLVVVFV